MNRVNDTFRCNKEWIFLALISTFAWGMLAHGYCFLDNNFTHDSLVELNGWDYAVLNKIRLGRVLAPVYWAVFRGYTTLPWLAGCLTCLWIGLSVYLLIHIFQVKSHLMVVLIAGMMITNTTVSATAATYIHDLDSYMFSLLCAVGAVFCWQQYPKWGVLLGGILTAISLGIYQSFLFAAVTLALLRCILDLLEGGTFRIVFCKGMKAIGILAVGGILYWVLLQVLLKCCGTTLYSDGSNTLDAPLAIPVIEYPRLLYGAYRKCYSLLVKMDTAYPQVLIRIIANVLIFVFLAVIGVGVIRKCLGLREKLLCLVLVGLLPLGMNGIYILVNKQSHLLMVYPVWLFYVGVLLFAEWLAVRTVGDRKKHAARFLLTLTCVLVTVILYSNIQLSNGMYLKKDIEHDGFLSIMTRVADRMEACDGYIPGETPVVFAGIIRRGPMMEEVMPGFQQFSGVMGMDTGDVMRLDVDERYQTYFDNVLCIRLKLAEPEIWNQVLNSEETAQMSPFPSADCVEMRNGILIVKLS